MHEVNMLKYVMMCGLFCTNPHTCDTLDSFVLLLKAIIKITNLVGNLLVLV